MLNKDLEKTLNEAFKLARDERHEFMTVEHLLLALLDNSSAHEALSSCGADVELMRKEISAFISQTTPLIPRDDEDRETQPTLGFQRVLQRAVFHVQSSGNTEVSGANVLVAIFSEQESQAAYFLKKAEISRLDVVNFLSHGVRKDSKPDNSNNNAESDDDVSAAQIESFATTSISWCWKGVSIRSSDGIRSSTVPSRCFAAVARTTPCWSVRPG